MIFLLLALLSSSVLAMVLKYLNSGSSYGVYFVNYVTCTLLAFAAMEPKALYRGDSTPCWLGGITGLIYLASLVANGYSIHKKRSHPVLGVYPSGGAGSHSGLCGTVRGAAYPSAGSRHGPGRGSGRTDERPA